MTQYYLHECIEWIIVIMHLCFERTVKQGHFVIFHSYQDEYNTQHLPRLTFIRTGLRDWSLHHCMLWWYQLDSTSKATKRNVATASCNRKSCFELALQCCNMAENKAVDISCLGFKIFDEEQLLCVAMTKIYAICNLKSTSNLLDHILRSNSRQSALRVKILKMYQKNKSWSRVPFFGSVTSIKRCWRGSAINGCVRFVWDANSERSILWSSHW